MKKLEKIMYSYQEEDCPRYAMRWGGCPFLFDKDMMFPVKYMSFENTKVMVPHRMSDYLIWHYGDEWSYIPPHGERESPRAGFAEIPSGARYILLQVRSGTTAFSISAIFCWQKVR